VGGRPCQSCLIGNIECIDSQKRPISLSRLSSEEKALKARIGLLEKELSRDTGASLSSNIVKGANSNTLKPEDPCLESSWQRTGMPSLDESLTTPPTFLRPRVIAVYKVKASHTHHSLQIKNSKVGSRNILFHSSPLSIR